MAEPNPSRPGSSLPDASLAIPQYQLEPLEPRVLLTTLVGGDIFEFRASDPNDPNGTGPTIRVVISGDAVVELIGADVNGNNELDLGDLPGVIYGIRRMVMEEIIKKISEIRFLQRNQCCKPR
jgi:hypothetical protein